MEVFVLFHILWSLPRGGTTHGGSRRSMLTKKQHELLLFIHRHLQKNGVSPSFDEMKDALALRSEEHTSELQSLMRISYAVFCLKKKNEATTPQHHHVTTNVSRYKLHTK